MDVLSDVLRVVRLTSAVFFTARFSSPWSIESPPPHQLARSLRLRAESIALFHVLVEGECWISIEGHDPLRMEARDVIIFPHGDAHIMSSRKGAKPQPISTLMPQPSEEIPQLDYGGGGESTRFVCGYLHCDQRFNPLIGALPTMLCVCSQDSARQSKLYEVETAKRPGFIVVEPDSWLAGTLRHTVEEADGGALRQFRNVGSIDRIVVCGGTAALHAATSFRTNGLAGWRERPGGWSGAAIATRAA